MNTANPVQIHCLADFYVSYLLGEFLKVLFSPTADGPSVALGIEKHSSCCFRNSSKLSSTSQRAFSNIKLALRSSSSPVLSDGHQRFIFINIQDFVNLERDLFLCQNHIESLKTFHTDFIWDKE